MTEIPANASPIRETLRLSTSLLTLALAVKFRFCGWRMLVGLRAAARAYGRDKIGDEGPQIGSCRAQDYGGRQDPSLRVQRPWRRWMWWPLMISSSRDSRAVKVWLCGLMRISACWWSSQSPTRGNHAL